MSDPTQANSSQLDRALQLAFGSGHSETGSAFQGLGLPGTPELGARDSDYTLLSPLGEGGMGKVFLAFDQRLERHVALKAIREDHQLDGTARSLFFEEARILAQLDHPNICRIFDLTVLDGREYLILEWIEGTTVARALGESPDRRTRFDIGLSLMDALRATHAQGVVHRDLKPANLMLTEAGDLKILDFGLGAREGALDLTRRLSNASPGGHVAAGTPAYMSPEQATGSSSGPAADIFAAGLIFLELFGVGKGRPANTTQAELREHIRTGWYDESSLPKGSLGKLVRAMLGNDPAGRPTAAEVHDRLTRIVGKPTRIAFQVGALLLLSTAAAASTKYVLDLDRAEARIKRHSDASSSLVDFMLDEHWAEVAKLGDLDALDSIWQGVQAHLDALPQEEQTDESLLMRSEALRRQGTALGLSTQGEVDEAKRAFTEAWWIAEELHRRDPEDPERRFTLSQAQFELGNLAYQVDDLPTAHLWMSAYAETSRRLSGAAPDNLDYEIEVLWAEQSVASIELGMGDAEGAAAIFQRCTSAWRDLTVRFPEEPGWRLELADALSWLGEATAVQGRTRDALAPFAESVELWETLCLDSPEDWSLKLSRSETRSKLARLQHRSGEVAASGRGHDRAVATMRELHERDARNADWTRSLAMLLFARAELRADSRGPAGPADSGALGDIHEGGALMEQLRKLDPDNADYSAEWIPFLVRECELLQPTESGPQLESALARTLAGFELVGAGSTRTWRAHLDLVLAREARRSGSLAESREIAARAEAFFRAAAAGSNDPRLHDSWIQALALIGKLDEARTKLDALAAQGDRRPGLIEAVAAAAR